ncbi:MAG: alpha/beta hydrolase family protein [Actinomycetota bacterium]
MKRRPRAESAAPRELTLALPDGRREVNVRAVADLPASVAGPGLLLTHGAGGDIFGAGLSALAAGLAGRGHPVVRFNLPYREAGRTTPPAAERSVPAYAAAFEQAGEALSSVTGTWSAGGKSYGGRVASMAVAEGMPAAGLVFYGYPLHPPGHADRLRVDHWPAIRVPCLFLQGTDDPFCDLALLQRNLDLLGGSADLYVVEGGNHSLRVRGQTEGAVLADLAPRVAAWLEQL